MAHPGLACLQEAHPGWAMGAVSRLVWQFNPGFAYGRLIQGGLWEQFISRLIHGFSEEQHVSRHVWGPYEGLVLVIPD